MLGLLNHGRLFVGYDMGNDYAQISYAFSDSEEIETLSSVAGEQNYCIPAVLCKKPGVNQWFYGKEALRHAEEQGGILVENLLSMAVDGEPVQIEGESYQPEALLALFMKRSLGLLSQIASLDKIYELAVTCERLEGRTLEAFRQAVAGIFRKTPRVFFESHDESYYHYMLGQPKELWEDCSILCDYRESRILLYRFEPNRNTTPTAVFIEEETYPFPSWESFGSGEELRKMRMERLDQDFLEIVQKAAGSRNVNSFFLIGENFSEQWMQESLRFLCRGRRVFQGNNLYSKGACFGLLAKYRENGEEKNHVFLGKDKLRANVGMKLMRQGQESYLALLNAGGNWFETEKTLEFYLQDGNSIEIIITPLMGKGSKLAQMILEDLPKGLTRLKACFSMTKENQMTVEIEDLGLGDFRPATHRIWKEAITIY